MSWEFFLAISVVSGVAATLYHRRLQHHGGHGELGYGVISGTMSAGLIAVFLLFTGFDTRWELVPWENVALMVVFWAGADMLLNLAHRATEASLFSVLFTTRVFWGIVAALIFLDESMSLKAVIGTLLIAGSVILVVYKPGLTWASRPALLTLGASFFFGLALTNDGIVVRDGFDVPTYYIVAFLLPAIAIAAFSKSARKSAADLVKTGEYKGIFPLAVLHVISGLAFLEAFQAGQDLSIVQSLNQTQTILVVLGALIFLRERKNIGRRVVASIISFVGVLLVVLS